MTDLFRNDPTSLLRHWSIDAGAIVIPASAGVNNKSFRIETARQRFILRISSDANARARIAQEILLLTALQRLELPFRTPIPRSTTANDPYLVVEGSNACCVTLFEVIPGVHATAGNAAQARHCGEALGRLDTTMQEIDAHVIRGLIDLLPLGGLGQYAIADDIELPASVRGNVDRILEHVALASTSAAQAFAMQPIHCDFFPSNVLVEGNDISGIIDFEYAAMGPAVLDLAIGLWTFGSTSDAFDWQAIEAFAAGYVTGRPIRKDEIEAIPAMILIREAGSLMHWTDRYRQGLISQEEVKERVDRLLKVERIVTAGAAELVQRVALAIDVAGA
jgi:homoserine kinase type II